MPKKYYAVRKGICRGIFFTWPECQLMTHGYSGAEFKGFNNLQDAENYIKGYTQAAKKPQQTTQKKKGNSSKMKYYAYVDGSYNSNTGYYGWGGFVSNSTERIDIQGCDNDKEMAKMRNVAGELNGAVEAIDKALSLGWPSLTLYYDYAGIEKWATGEWQAKKLGTKRYVLYIKSVKNKINLSFQKVTAHTGIEGNEIADRLAKEAVGIEVH